MSARLDALSELRGRLRGILVSAGYETDAGENVFLNEAPTLGPDDPPAAVAIVVGPSEIRHQADKVTEVVPVELHALVPVDLAEPWVAVEAIVGDLHVAVEQDYDLAATTLENGVELVTVRPREREEGSAFVGAVVEYQLLLERPWGGRGGAA